MIATTMTDAELLGAPLGGNRNAFAAIVERYKSLVCIVAYSGTGSLARSEDLAQDTFVAAWTRLGAIREPQKLPAWLCGIARNLAMRDPRKRQRDALAHAAPLDNCREQPGVRTSPRDAAISKEQEAVLWRASTPGCASLHPGLCAVARRRATDIPPFFEGI